MATGYRSLASNRDFQRLWIGQTVSEVGTGISRFVLPLVAYAISGSAFQTALVAAAQGLGTVLFLLPAGALVDRWDRRDVLVRSSLAGLAAYVSLTCAGVTGHLTVVHLALAACVTGLVEAFGSPAESSTVRRIVASRDLPTALSQNQARMQAAGLVSGPLGGVLLGLSRTLPFLVDAVSYLVAALMLRRLRTPLGPTTTNDGSSGIAQLRRDIAHGVRFVRRHSFARVFLPWAACSNMITNALMFVVLLRMLDAGWSAAVIGLAELPVGLAGIGGAMVAPWVIQRVRGRAIALVTVWVWPCVCLPLVWWVSPWVLAACIVPAVFLNPIGNAGLASFRMHTTPQQMQARTSSAGLFLVLSCAWLAQPVGAALHARWGGAAAVAVILGLMVATALPVTLSRAVREVGRPDEWPSAETYLRGA